MYTFFEKSHLKKCGADVLDCLGVSEFLYDAKTDISEYFTDDIDMLRQRSIIFVNIKNYSNNHHSKNKNEYTYIRFFIYLSFLHHLPIFF